MAKKWADLYKTLSPERQRRIEAKVAALRTIASRRRKPDQPQGPEPHPAERSQS